WESKWNMSVRQKLAFFAVSTACLAGCNSSAPVQEKHASIQPSATAGVEVPEGFAAPIYPGSIAKFIYGPIQAETKEDVVVILQTQDDASKIASFYKKELPKRGWTVSSGTPTSEGITISASNSTQALKVEIADNVDSRMINLTVGQKK
ncbi:MAG TPA: hypothetical protein V6C69_08815, partial [Trichormus sp.]